MNVDSVGLKKCMLASYDTEPGSGGADAVGGPYVSVVCHKTIHRDQLPQVVRRGGGGVPPDTMQNRATRRTLPLDCSTFRPKVFIPSEI